MSAAVRRFSDKTPPLFGGSFRDRFSSAIDHILRVLINLQMKLGNSRVSDYKSGAKIGRDRISNYGPFIDMIVSSKSAKTDSATATESVNPE